MPNVDRSLRGEAEQQRPRRHWLRFVPLASGLLLVCITLRDLDLGSVRTSLTALSPAGVSALVAINVLAIVAFSSRWAVLLRGLGATVPLANAVLMRVAAFGVSFVTPGPQFGGEPVQVALISGAHGVPLHVAVASVTLDKAIELLANAAFLAVGVGLWFLHGPVSSSLPLGSALVAGALLLLPLAYLAALGSGARPFAWLARILRLRAKWRDLVGNAEALASSLCRDRPAVLRRALLASSFAWAVQIAEFWWMLVVVGVSPSVVDAILLLTLLRVAFLMPFPGGLGAVEAALVVGFAALGWPTSEAVACLLWIRARDAGLAAFGVAWGTQALQAWRSSATSRP